MRVPSLSKLIEIVAPRTWGGVALRTGAIVTVIHMLNVALAQVIPGLNYSAGDAVACTLLATPLFTGFMAMLKHLLQLRRELTVLATTDMLTGLPNRRDFMACARAALEREGRGVLLLLDADHFKQINGRWGHGIGDAALIAIGHHLRATLRDDDILGRLGGEEFRVFLSAASAEEARLVGLRLCRPIPVCGPSDGLCVTLSVGAALAGPAASLDRLMAQADRFLYLAKAEGRARMHLAEAAEEQAA